VAADTIPSFFMSHAFNFADAHIRLRGREQTNFLSAMRAAIDAAFHYFEEDSKGSIKDGQPIYAT
jgi:hypothetical protein